MTTNAEPGHFINVNLKPCDCGYANSKRTRHVNCRGAPILMPYRVPRFVKLTVQLGTCDCPMSPGYKQGARGFPYPRPFGADRGHALDCPARPIEVSCVIAGETWEKSQIVEIEAPPDSDGDAQVDAALAACRDTWEVVKALLLGASVFPVRNALADGLLAERDAVFAALADMAMAEEALWCAVGRLPSAIAAAVCHAEQRPLAEARAAVALAAYVKHLVSQVGALR